MSDFADMCEMWGEDPADPDAIDNIIDRMGDDDDDDDNDDDDFEDDDE